MSEDVFRDAKGHKVLKGAGAVKKVKKIGNEERVLQRFISNLIPGNEYQCHITGGDQYHVGGFRG